MSIPLISKIVPQNSGAFPIAEDINIEGGYQVQPTVAAMEAIPTLNRKAGMLVFVQANSYFYQLNADLITWEIVFNSTDNPLIQKILNQGKKSQLQNYITQTYSGSNESGLNKLVELDGIVFFYFNNSIASTNSSIAFVYPPTNNLNATTLTSYTNMPVIDICTYKTNNTSWLAVLFSDRVYLYSLAITYGSNNNPTIVPTLQFNSHNTFTSSNFFCCSVVDVSTDTSLGPVLYLGGQNGTIYYIVLGNGSYSVQIAVSGLPGSGTGYNVRTIVAAVDQLIYCTQEITSSETLINIYELKCSTNSFVLTYVNTIDSNITISPSNPTAINFIISDEKYLYVGISNGIRIYSNEGLLNTLTEYIPASSCLDNSSVWFGTSFNSDVSNPYLIRLLEPINVSNRHIVDGSETGAVSAGICIDSNQTLSIATISPTQVQGINTNFYNSDSNIILGASDAQFYWGGPIAPVSDAEDLLSVNLPLRSLLRRFYFHNVVSASPSGQTFNLTVVDSNSGTLYTYSNYYPTAGGTDLIVENNISSNIIINNSDTVSILFAPTTNPTGNAPGWSENDAAIGYSNLLEFGFTGPVPSNPYTQSSSGYTDISSYYIYQFNLNFAVGTPTNTTITVSLLKNGISIANKNYNDSVSGSSFINFTVNQAILPTDSISYSITGSTLVNWTITDSWAEYTSLEYPAINNLLYAPFAGTITNIVLNYYVIQSLLDTSLVAHVYVNGVIQESHNFTEASPGNQSTESWTTSISVNSGDNIYIGIACRTTPTDIKYILWNDYQGTCAFDITFYSQSFLSLTCYRSAGEEIKNIVDSNKLAVSLSDGSVYIKNRIFSTFNNINKCVYSGNSINGSAVVLTLLEGSNLLNLTSGYAYAFKITCVAATSSERSLFIYDLLAHNEGSAIIDLNNLTFNGSNGTTWSLAFSTSGNSVVMLFTGDVSSANVVANVSVEILQVQRI